MDSETKASFEIFELAAAILLGLGAIGAAVAGHQEGLWGGASVEAYGEAAALTTRAATTYNDELTTYMQDLQTDSRAKELIWEGQEDNDEGSSQRKLGMASWMLLARLSDPAYAELGLPEAKRTAHANAPTQDDANQVLLDPDDFSTALLNDLGQDYIDAVFAPSQAEFDVAEAKFQSGRVANGNGDVFSLAGVIFTISLFFAGLSLVFKSNMRWGFFGVGAVVFAGALAYMVTLPWA